MDDAKTFLPDAALTPPPVIINPASAYQAPSRRWQGIPGVEMSGRRLWATWYSGGEGERPENHVLLVSSDDGGETWSRPRLAIDPPGMVRAFDPCLWRDPGGRLWLFWAQSFCFPDEETGRVLIHDGRWGIWAMRCDNPRTNEPAWTPPRRLCHGIMMNKPLVLSSGEWLLPAALWPREKLPGPAFERYRKIMRPNLAVSTNRGRTWRLRTGPEVAGRGIDEHMIVERRDGSLWMLIRMPYGIAESVSPDRGRTWSAGRDSGIAGPNSRFFIRRLASGKLLLVNHRNFTGRSHLTASLSDDDGRTWYGHLLLEDRERVSYPDGTQAENGDIHVVYDRKRGEEGEILLVSFREAHVADPARGAARIRRRTISRLR